MNDWKVIKMWADGVDVATHGIKVLRLPTLGVAAEEIEEITIPGRPEQLTERLGEYRNISKTVGLAFVGNNPLAAAHAVLSAETVRFSNEPDFVYEVVKAVALTVPRIIADWYDFDIVFIVKPLKRQATPQQLTGLSVSATNIGNVDARPKIEVTASGTQTVTIAVGDQEITLQSVSGKVTIDSELQTVTDASGNLASYKMIGDYPVIKSGETVTITTTNATSVKIWPNWRWR